jgi:hypothetical protein
VAIGTIRATVATANTLPALVRRHFAPDLVATITERAENLDIKICLLEIAGIKQQSGRPKFRKAIFTENL